MTREEFIEQIGIIMSEEAWQCRRGRIIKISRVRQRRAINAIAKALNLEKLSKQEVTNLGQSWY